MLTRALFAFRKIINFVSSYSVSKNIWISSNQIRKNTFFDHLYMRNRSSFRFCLVSLVSNVIASKERKISCKYCAVGKRTPIAFWMRNKFGDTTLHNLSCFFFLFVSQVSTDAKRNYRVICCQNDVQYIVFNCNF